MDSRLPEALALHPIPEHSLMMKQLSILSVGGLGF
jgi:hypothetical protein